MSTDHTEIDAGNARLLADARRMALSGEARALRIAADLTPRELADAVGVSRQTIGLWETGQVRPRGQNAYRYATALAELRANADRARGTAR